MMPNIQLGFWDVVASSGVTALLTGILLFVFRGPVSAFLSRASTHGYDKQLTEFKSLLNTAATEREKISEYLLEGKQGRDAALNAKRLEAAEILYRELERVDKLFSGTVVSVQILNVDYIRKEASAEDAKKIQDILEEIHDLREKMNKSIPETMVLPELYLDQDINKLFRTYQVILHQSSLVLSTLGLQEEAEQYFNFAGLREEVEALYPSAKDGFDKFGDNFAYRFLPTIKADLLNQLRGVAGFTGKDAEDHQAAMAAITMSQNTPETLRRLREGGVSGKFFVHPENLPD